MSLSLSILMKCHDWNIQEHKFRFRQLKCMSKIKITSCGLTAIFLERENDFLEFVFLFKESLNTKPNFSLLAQLNTFCFVLVR